MTELIDHGLNRGKYASACVVAVVEELKKSATNNKEYAFVQSLIAEKAIYFIFRLNRCRVLAVIDGFNSFFNPYTRALREDKTPILTSECLLTDAFLSISKTDWVYI